MNPADALTPLYDHTTADKIPGDWEQAAAMVIGGAAEASLDPGVTLPAGGLCDESWSIGKTGYSCVKLTKTLKRKMTPTESVCDFAIDYVVHTVKI